MVINSDKPGQIPTSINFFIADEPWKIEGMHHQLHKFPIPAGNLTVCELEAMAHWYMMYPLKVTRTGGFPVRYEYPKGISVVSQRDCNGWQKYGRNPCAESRVSITMKLVEKPTTRNWLRTLVRLKSLIRGISHIIYIYIHWVITRVTN